MADNSPVAPEKDATSTQTPAPQADATKAEVEIPTFAKGLDKTEVKTEVQPEAVAPTPQEEQAPLKERLSEAISTVEKRNEEARRFVTMQVEIVRENNELIHKIATSDPVLANKVIAEVWKEQGIRSYKQLMERSKLEELKAQDPNAYESQKRLMDVENKLTVADERERKRTRETFFKSKNILENDYDPKYKAVMDALETVNPSLVTEDYDKALRSAYAIALSEPLPIARPAVVPTLEVGGAQQPAPIPSSTPQHSDQTTWLADSLNKKLGYKIQL